MHVRLALFFASIVTLAIVHIVSLEFYLYWKYLWLDIPIHFLGGISVALGISILPYIRITLPEYLSTLTAYVSAVLAVGLIWEMFEIFLGISIIDENFASDTAVDLLMDVLGGVVGYGISKRITHLDV